MATGFISLCDQILEASSPHAPYDTSKKPLSAMLNEMTHFVATTSNIESRDDSIVYGLQILLLSDVERVRAASLRALRYSIHRATIFDKFLELRLDYLVCRSLTIDLRNARERLEAYKFIRRVFHLYPQRLPHSFVHILDAIVASSYSTSVPRTGNSTPIVRSDHMVKCCLELLCEIALQNPHILQECHAINTMLKYIIDLEQDELRDSVLYSLLHVVDRFTINDNSEPTIVNSVDPNGPSFVLIDEGMRERHELIGDMFSQLVAIFSLCEKGTLKTGDRRGTTSAVIDNLIIKEPDKLKTLKSCGSALRTVLHSWIGLTAFCQTRNSCIRLLVNCLLVQSEPMKMIILDLFYDLLNLDIPALCDNYESALKSMFPTWNLTTVEEGYTYVAFEGASKLPRLSFTRPNLLDSHMALMLLTLIDAGLIEAVSELASNDNSILSIRATLLLANFIWMCNEHLPEEQSFLLLPLLMDVAIADDDSVKRSFAKEAMLNINAFFEYKQRTSHLHSFQLAQLIYHAQHVLEYHTLPPNIQADNRRLSMTPSSDPLAAEKIDASIRDTNILHSNDFRRWNWDLILSLLKDFPKQANHVQGDFYETFLDKLCDFFKPEFDTGFNSISLTDSLSDVTCRALIAFADLLIYPSQMTSNHIKIIANNNVHVLLQCVSDALQESITSMRECSGRAKITEHDLLAKNSVYYYLFLGRLSKSNTGTQALVENHVFVRLSEMLNMEEEFATSAIVALSSFNYYYDTACRAYLAQALKSPCLALRLYSTSLLRVLLRLNPTGFGAWGLSFLISQLQDADQAVSIEAVSILDEALEDRRLVNLFYKQWDSFGPMKNLTPFLSKIYHLAVARISSIPFHHFSNNQKHFEMLRDELAYWDSTFNAEYVTLIETKLFSAYSGGSLLTDDYFERRKTTSLNQKNKVKKPTAHVSSHIYRQLCLHHEGFRLLVSESRVERYVTELRQRRANCINVNETNIVKEALWALANMASTEYGYGWFVDKDLLPDFLRHAEECQNLSVRGTAFYALSLIAQTPDGAISLKEYGWETYRVRSHSIPLTSASTDTYQNAERRISRGGVASSPRKSISLQVAAPVFSATSNLLEGKFKPVTANEQTSAETVPSTCSQSGRDSNVSEGKSRRSLTMPSSMSMNHADKTNVLHVIIPEESGSTTPSSNTTKVSFTDGLEFGATQALNNVPIRRCSSISKELTSATACRDSDIASGATNSFTDLEYSRSPSYQAYSSHTSSQLAAEQLATDSLPLERFRPRSKSAHQSNALRQSKQLQKVPEVIQALRAPTAGHGAASEPSATDELYRSRLLRCNFLLKPDAAGYEYARRVQKISHATYSQLVQSNHNDVYAEEALVKEKSDGILLPLYKCTSKYYKKIYETYDLRDQNIEQFMSDDGKYSSDQRDTDDADEDGNTVYRGLAVPVDIRQVIEMSDIYNLNGETLSDFVRSRSRGNTNTDQARARSATGASNSSGELTSTSPAVGLAEQIISTTLTVPTNPTPITSTATLNICMMCVKDPINSMPHENIHVTMQAEFNDIKALASRLIAAIHTEEVEKKLLSWKESRPQIFDNICLYSEICYILTLSSVRVQAQRFLHDLFSDCQFQKLRRRRHLAYTLTEEEEEDDDDDSMDSSSS